MIYKLIFSESLIHHISLLLSMSCLGFTTPTLFNQEIVDFFTHANIGSLVDGTFKEDSNKPDVNSLQSTQQRLNDSLIFTKSEIDGQPNLHYRIVNAGSLTPLFALHTHYSQMQHADDKTRLSASQDMRKYLRQTMIKVIENDCSLISEGVHPENDDIRQEVNETKQKMIDCIDNPDDLSLKGKVYRIDNNQTLEIFNPNWFLYAHFSKIISAARPEIDSVLKEQHKLIQLARAYKNNLQRVNK